MLIFLKYTFKWKNIESIFKYFKFTVNYGIEEPDVIWISSVDFEILIT